MAIIGPLANNNEYIFIASNILILIKDFQINKNCSVFSLPTANRKASIPNLKKEEEVCWKRQNTQKARHSVLPLWKKKKVLLVGECFWENSEFGRKHGKKRQTRKLAKGEKSYLPVAENGFGGQLHIFLWLGRLDCCLEKRLDVRDILLGLLFLSNEQRNAPISFAGGCQRKKGKEEEKVLAVGGLRLVGWRRGERAAFFL